MVTRRLAGFSLIELLVSAAILGLLASIAVPFVETTVRREKERALRIALRDIRQAIDAYQHAAATGRIKAPADSGCPKTLTDLTSGATDLGPRGGKLYFLRRIPRDPFFADSSVAAANTWGLRSYASSDDAPKKGDDVFDVYSQSKQTGMNGIPYKEW
ncbi:type II secretion system protein [Duganella sp. LX47W]|uniref:Type II secretion system protein n=2 Tax=Rugamonas apoptosis TaxID=2758570 RepID=A0A7W2FE20_9BURK|nr:type II secretion system protein [Rugamonas apoptosis]